MRPKTKVALAAVVAVIGAAEAVTYLLRRRRETGRPEAVLRYARAASPSTSAAEGLL